MTRSRTVLVWHISSTTYPIRPDAFERAGLNLDQIVSIEPEHVSPPRPAGQSGTPLAVSRVYVAAQSGVYTHKNDSYAASRYNKPEIETRGGAPVQYTVLVPLDEALERARKGLPFEMPPGLVAWLIEDATESWHRLVARQVFGGAAWAWGSEPGPATLFAFAQAKIALPWEAA